MKQYEIIYIIPSPFTENEAPAIQKTVAQIIEESGGKIINEENLGNKKLAYSIKNIKRGFYVVLNFEGTSEVVKKIEQKLKLMPEVLRFSITDFVEHKKASPESRTTAERKKTASEPILPEEDLRSLDDKIDELLKI